MGKKVTIHDIASLAGVSPSTVSRVLNHPDIVNGKTREAIFDAIEQLEYIPQASIKSGPEKKSIIGLAVPDIRLPMLGGIIRDLNSELADTEYDLLLINMKGERVVSRFFIENTSYKKKIDAIIIFSAIMDEISVDFFRAINVPVVIIQNRCSQEKSISTNNYLGAFDAVKYLISRSYKTIAFIGWEPEDGHLNDRFYGYKNAIEKAGMTFDTDMIAYAPLSVEGGFSATKILLEKARPDAIFYACDSMAFGGYKYFTEVGISIPKDIGIVGFDDYEMASVVGLTTMKQFIGVKTRMAVSYLLDRLSGRIKTPNAEEVCITPRLVVRGSTL
jgi:LacI family transcriptional regulator